MSKSDIIDWMHAEIAYHNDQIAKCQAKIAQLSNSDSFGNPDEIFELLHDPAGVIARMFPPRSGGFSFSRAQRGKTTDSHFGGAGFRLGGEPSRSSSAFSFGGNTGSATGSSSAFGFGSNTGAGSSSAFGFGGSSSGSTGFGFGGNTGAGSSSGFSFGGSSSGSTGFSFGGSSGPSTSSGFTFGSERIDTRVDFMKPSTDESWRTKAFGPNTAVRPDLDKH